MDLATLRRQHIAWVIAQNLTTVTIQRTEKVDRGGYFDEIKSQHGPVKVRIFPGSSQNQHDVAGLAGTKQVDRGWVLLADHHADLRAGSNLKDEFDVPGVGHFLVKAVYPQIIQGQTVGVQADLEKVS